MTITPWEEARRQMLDAAVKEYELIAGTAANSVKAMDFALVEGLATLSRHGWRLVPAEATDVMIEVIESYDETADWRETLSAVNDAGDVLKEGK